jgi:hypothetical protein
MIEKIAIIKRTSPIDWLHISLGGRFTLTGHRKPIEINLLVSILSKVVD